MGRKSQKHQGKGKYHQDIRSKNITKLEKFLDQIEAENNSKEQYTVPYRKWPSIAEISRETGLHYKTIKKIIDDIEKNWDGYIKFKIVFRGTMTKGRRLNQKMGVVYYPNSYTSSLEDWYSNSNLFYEG